MNPSLEFEEVVRAAVDEEFTFARSLTPEEDAILVANRVISEVRKWMGKNGIVFYQP